MYGLYAKRNNKRTILLAFLMKKEKQAIECPFISKKKRMTRNRYIAYLIVLGLTIAGCKKPFYPSVVSSPNHYLVVEGVIDVGDSVTVIKLSQSVNLADNVKTSALVGYT